MVNNPGAMAGHATLLPLTQQAPAAELDNVTHVEGPSEASSSSISYFLYSCDQYYFCGFCF